MKADELKEDKKVALVAILGVTPAVLTEAVWALAHQNCPVVPDDILILTTGTGKKNLDEQVQIDKRKGVWASLKHDLAADGVSVEGKLNIRVELFLDENNRPTEDLPTEAANLRAADKMMKELRDYTDDDDWIVYGLLAGGRKTMSALFFSCMCLLGRRDDRVYHVLVSEGYENRLMPPFCYPQRGVVHCGKISNPKVGRKGAPAQIDVKLKSENCKINLFSVPFVCMGEWCQKKCKGKRLSYSRLIDAIGDIMDADLIPSITIDFKGAGEILIDGMKFPYRSPGLFPLMVLLCQGVTCPDDVVSRLEGLQRMLRDLDEKDHAVYERVAMPGAGGRFTKGRPEGHWWLDELRESGMFFCPKIEQKSLRLAEEKKKFFNQIKDRMNNEKMKKAFPLLRNQLFEGKIRSEDVCWENSDCVDKRIAQFLFVNMPGKRC